MISLFKKGLKSMMKQSKSFRTSMLLKNLWLFILGRNKNMMFLRSIEKNSLLSLLQLKIFIKEEQKSMQLFKPILEHFHKFLPKSKMIPQRPNSSKRLTRLLLHSMNCKTCFTKEVSSIPDLEISLINSIKSKKLLS